jgi:SAM-dependent methyltransferase
MKEIIRESGRHFLNKVCRLSNELVTFGSGSWQGLHTIYTYKPKGLIERAVAPFTIDLEGSKDTRNRLGEYTDLIVDVLDADEPRKYLDIACGSALGPITAARRTKNPDATLKCSDISKSALEFAGELAFKEGVKDRIEFERYKAGEVNTREPIEEYDGAGTHGHVDYLTPQGGVELFKKIGEVIKPGGKLITTNMMDKPGMTKFMMEFFAKWKLDYKDEETLGNMFYDAGFDDIDVWTTPLGYHVMGTGNKK